MGFNISGIAINKSYKNDIEQLQSDFNWIFSKENEVTFEGASKNWTKKGICYVYFTDIGTLIFLEMDRCAYPYSLENSNCLTFALSETSMAFNLDYYEGKKMRRSIMEINNERLEDSGSPLTIEKASDDIINITFGQISNLIGKDFLNINPIEKALKLTFATKNDASDIYKEIYKLINKKNVSDGLTALEELKNHYAKYFKLGSKLSPVEYKAVVYSRRYNERKIKEFIYVISKDWESLDKKEKNPIMSNILITTTAIMWFDKKIDVLDMKNGTFVYKKWWEFRKNTLKDLKKIYPQ